MLGTGFPDLIALAYESAYDLSRLPELAADTGGYFRADVAAIAIWPRRDPANGIASTYGTDNAAITGWLTDSQAADSVRARLETAAPLQPFEAVAAEGSGPGWPDGAVLAVVVDADANNVCALILFRNAPGLFSHADHDGLAELAAYLQRAIGLNQRFSRLFAEHRAARTLLDSAPRGIVILGQRGQATYTNDEARRICNGNDGVELVGDRLRFTDERAGEEFQRFLDAARANGADDSSLPVIGMRVMRLSEAAPYQLIAYALHYDPREAALDPREGLAVAMLHDPTKPGMPDERLLHTYFDLTPAEAQLAHALCAGQSLPSAARAANISVNTARTHLRSVFRKMGIHSQAALVQRVSQSLHLTSPLD